MEGSYVTLTPFGDHKAYALEAFIEGLRSLQPQPKEMWICADIDTIHREKLEDTGCRLFWNPEVFCNSSELERICSAREILRKKFIYSQYNWALWIDSDIVLEPEAPKKFFSVIEQFNCLLVSNLYPSSDIESDSTWSGSGIMFCHRTACTASRFWVSDVQGKNLSEDFVFLSILDHGRYFIKMYINKETRVIGRFVRVKHLLMQRQGDNTIVVKETNPIDGKS